MSEKIGCICHYGWGEKDPCKVHPHQAYGSLLDEIYATSAGRDGMQKAHEEFAVRLILTDLKAKVEELKGCKLFPFSEQIFLDSAEVLQIIEEVGSE